MAGKAQKMVIVNHSDNPDGTLNLMVTWTNITMEERQEILSDMAEELGWPTDERDLLPYSTA